MNARLSQTFPILEVSNDCIVSKSGDYTVARQLIKPEIFTLSGTALEAYHQAWVRALRILPHDTIVHMQDWYLKSYYQADFERGDCSPLGLASERFFHHHPYLKHRSFLFITKKAAGRDPSRWMNSTLPTILKNNLVPQELLRPESVQEFLDQVAQFEHILADSGFLELRKLNCDDLSGSSSRPGIIEQYYQLTDPDLALANRISPAEIKDISFQSGMHIGDNECITYSLADAVNFPAQCACHTDYPPYSSESSRFSLGFASPLGLLLGCNHIYNQFIFIEDPQPLVKKLELKKRRLQSLMTHSRENSISRDAVDNFLNEAIQGQKLFVKVHFNIVSWSDNPAEVKDLKKKVSSAISYLGAIPHLETTGSSTLWLAGIPGNAASLPTSETIDTFAELAACFLIPDTNYHSSISPIGIRLGDRISGYPVSIDISDEPLKEGRIFNRNKFVLGGSGSGKSFFTCHLLRTYFEQGAHSLIIDIGHSYKGLCNFLEGYYFTYTEQNPIRFNPFWIAKDDQLDIEKKESIKALLLSIWKKENDAIFRSEYVALSNALQWFYTHLAQYPDIFPCFDTFYEFMQTKFAEELTSGRVREKDFDLNNFLYVLRPFYRTGEYDYLLNATEQLDLLHQRFLVFELDNIKDHPILFPIVTIIIMEIFTSKMRKLAGIRKVILIEEAWKAIARQGMSEYIRYLFKTIRKFQGEAIVVTQEIEDIISSPVVRQSVINNADCKILLDQSKFQNRFDQIQDLLGLSEKDKSLVLSLNKANDPARRYKEVFIALGNSYSQVFRTQVSLEEYLCYTTEESEKLKVQAYASRFGNFRDGVMALAAAIRNGQDKL